MSQNREPISDVQRDEFTRDELNAIAKSDGVENPESFRTKAEVVEAINAARAGNAGGDSTSDDAATDTPGTSGNAPAGSNPPLDDRPTGAAALNTTGQVVAMNPTAESVFGGETPVGSMLSYDTSAFQPPEGQAPVYGDARTRTLVDPDGKALDTGKPVSPADANRDK